MLGAQVDLDDQRDSTRPAASSARPVLQMRDVIQSVDAVDTKHIRLGAIEPRHAVAKRPPTPNIRGDVAAASTPRASCVTLVMRGPETDGLLSGQRSPNAESCAALDGAS